MLQLGRSCWMPVLMCALAAAAITAVKRWQFEPARRGDDKVTGEIELSFTFRK